MASVNKVILIGNLGRDPELRYNPSGVAFCTISLATTRQWKNRESGERQEETEWHRVVVWGKLAEFCEKYLTKGRQILIEGKLRTRDWQDKEGNDRYSTEIVGDRMQLLGGRGGSESMQREPAMAGSGDGGGMRGGGGSGGEARKPAGKKGGGFDEMDDDIPF